VNLYAFQPHMTRRQRLKVAKRSVRLIREMLGENHHAHFLRHMEGNRPNRHNRRMRMTIRQRSARRKQERAEQAYYANSRLEYFA